MQQKKGIIILLISISLPSVILAMAMILSICWFSRSAVVRDMENKYYTIKSFSIVGNTCIGLKSKESFQSRYRAIENLISDHGLSLISLDDISIIELIPKEDTKTSEGVYPLQYLGLYKVNVTGHSGFLYLREEKGKLSGAIRFPRWGRGVNEYLKGIQIKKNQLFFIRSAKTIEELRRIGGNTYFVQRYMGTYYDNGKSIRGFYFNDRGEKNIWEGVR